MGLRVEVEEGERIADVLKRFRQELKADGGFPIGHYRWHKKRTDLYQKPSVYRRRRRWILQFQRRRPYGWACGPDPDYWWVDEMFRRPGWCWKEI